MPGARSHPWIGPSYLSLAFRECEADMAGPAVTVVTYARVVSTARLRGEHPVDRYSCLRFIPRHSQYSVCQALVQHQRVAIGIEEGGQPYHSPEFARGTVEFYALCLRNVLHSSYNLMHAAHWVPGT